jgi:hypothetical protein
MLATALVSVHHAAGHQLAALSTGAQLIWCILLTVACTACTMPMCLHLQLVVSKTESVEQAIPA